MIKVKFLEKDIPYFSNFHSSRKNRELNKLVEELQKEYLPKQGELLDIVLLKEWNESNGTAHVRYFRFKFTYKIK